MEKINRFIVAVLRAVASAMFFAMTAIVAAQVLCRYALTMPLDWSDELARLLLVYTSFIGVTLIYFSKAGHPGVDYFIDKTPEKFHRAVNWVFDAVLLVGLLAVGRAGVDYSVKTHRFFSAVLHYRNSLKYGVVPACCFLMAFKALQNVLAPFAGKKGDE